MDQGFLYIANGGRHEDYEKVRASLNATPVNRSWDPVAGTCRPTPFIRYLRSYARYLARQFRRPHN